MNSQRPPQSLAHTGKKLPPIGSESACAMKRRLESAQDTLVLIEAAFEDAPIVSGAGNDWVQAADFAESLRVALRQINACRAILETFMDERGATEVGNPILATGHTRSDRQVRPLTTHEGVP